MTKEKIVSIEDRIPKLKQQRRKKANRRLIFLLLLFFVLIVIILYFQSPLSNVKYIKITGNRSQKYEELLNKADISTGTNIWKVDKKEITSKLQQLPQIKKVDVKIKLPNTVVIEIKELKRIAYLSRGKKFLPVLENGDILDDEQVNYLPINAPNLFGFSENDALKKMINSLEEMPKEIQNSISEIHYEPIKTDSYHIYIYMNDGNEVSATISTFAEKMAHYPSIISQLGPKQKGVINLEVGSYFKAYKSQGDEQKGEIK